MSQSPVVYTIDKDHFTVKLHDDLLEVDLKEGVRKELEDLAEAQPILKATIGMLYQFAGPLDVPLKNVEKVLVENDGRLRVVIPNRRDLHIPLTPAEADSLSTKLSELIPKAKAKAAEEEELTSKSLAEHEAERGRQIGPSQQPLGR